MDANGVNMVAIGLEHVGEQEFVDGGFFEGDVFVDEGKKSYRDLGYKRFNLINIWIAILSRVSRMAISEIRRLNITGNLSGDGLQNGGVLIIDKGGSKILLNHREENPGDNVANEVVLQSLGIAEVIPSDKSEQAVDHEEPAPECSEQCALPPQGTSEKKTN